MSLAKRILDSAFIRQLLFLVAAAYIRFVHLTSRWTVHGGDIPEKYWNQDRPFILCFWHGRLMMMPYCWNHKKPIHTVVSMHRDGRMVSGIFAHFGIKTIAGSTSRGGASALRTMIRTLKAGDWVGITPDGPRGPRMRVSEGIITLARMSNIPIIPVTYSFRRRKILGSWDRFIVSLPFSRGVFVWGEPIIVPHTAKKETLESSRLDVEQALNALCVEADTLCGHQPVEPAVIKAGDAAS